MVRPAEKIGTITIHKVDGLNGTRSDGVNGSGGSGNGLVNQAFDEIRRNAFELPALSAIGKSVGMNMDTGLAGIMEPNSRPKRWARLSSTPCPTFRKQVIWQR